MLPSSSWVAWRVMVMRVLSVSASCPVCICKIVQSTSQQRVCYYPFWSNNHFYAHFCVVSKAISCYTAFKIIFILQCVFKLFIRIWGRRLFAWEPPHLSLLSLDIIIPLQKCRSAGGETTSSSPPRMIASWWGWKRILKILMNHSPLDYVCGKRLVAGGGVGGDMNIVLRDTGAGVSDYVTRLPLTQWNNETWPPASSLAAREEN